MNEPRMNGFRAPVVPARAGRTGPATSPTAGSRPAVPARRRHGDPCLRQGRFPAGRRGAGVEAFPAAAHRPSSSSHRGAYVFPGGSVDRARRPIPASGGRGPGPADFAAPARRAAGPRPGPLVLPPRSRETVRGVRRCLLAGSVARRPDQRQRRAGRGTGTPCWPGRPSLAEVLGRRDLVLRTDLLTPWAPLDHARRPSPRRFDNLVLSPPPCRPGRRPPGGAGGSRGSRGIRVGGLAAAPRRRWRPAPGPAR